MTIASHNQLLVLGILSIGLLRACYKEQVIDEPEMQANSFGVLVSIDFAQGMAILKTLPGHAGSIAYNIDHLNAYEVGGTIAGDDTILLIPRDGVSKSALINMLKVRLPGLIREQVH